MEYIKIVPKLLTLSFLMNKKKITVFFYKLIYRDWYSHLNCYVAISTAARVLNYLNPTLCVLLRKDLRLKCINHGLVSQKKTVQSTGAEKYTDCISAEG